MIGIDVGGANLKVATTDGIFIHYCPLWQESPIHEVLCRYRSRGKEAAVVMSGELADCFSSKAEGIRFIVDAVRRRSRMHGSTAPMPRFTMLPYLNWQPQTGSFPPST